MTTEEAIKQAFILFSGNYGKKWEPSANTVAAWLLIFEGQDAREIMRAALKWCRDGKEWPPSAGELYRIIPDNCLCGECIRCNTRALERRLSASKRNNDTDWRSILPPRPTLRLEEGNSHG